MKFVDTRGNVGTSNASEAIVKGLASDGGLFVPESFPFIFDKIEDLLIMDYAERAAFILSQYLDEYDYSDLIRECKRVYGKFEANDPAPVVKIDKNLYIMELFHGPTFAFKDLALQILPYLLRQGADRVGIKEEILILVATSGDTGKAALEGFKDNPGIKINVFYPSEGVSKMQKLQMSTQEGKNVNVIAVEGNFDDCQTAVKEIFASAEKNAELKEKGIVLSSANSINFGRLAPQIVYYFSAYCDLVNSDQIEVGDKVDFVVPTGNFGDILAGYYAKKMGLPINKLICASNKNNILTDFFRTGEYNTKRPFYKTSSPSMDILVSSNLERLLYDIANKDTDLIKERMNSLKKNGIFRVTLKELNAMKEIFTAGCIDEEETYDVIEDLFDEYGYLCDTHTAVALGVERKVNGEENRKIPTIVLSTASPYKFPQDVLMAINSENESDAFTASKILNVATAMPIPKKITELERKPIRFNTVVDKSQMFDEILEFIK